MPKKKGDKKTGGRKKGSENKVKKEIKEAYKDLVERNLDKIESWLNRVARHNPDKALDLLHKFSQFNIALLARAEIKSENINRNETIVIDTTGKHEENNKIHS